MTVNVVNLRAEHRWDAFGIGVPRPRLSWIVESDDTSFEQQAYEVTVVDLDSMSESTSHVESDESVLVPWPFDPLPSRARRRVRVRVAGADGAFSKWSEPLDIEVGLLVSADWSAVPITATFDDSPPERPIRFRRGFVVRDGLVRARMYASALGVYTVACNGSMVGDDVLAPGWTFVPASPALPDVRHRRRPATWRERDRDDRGRGLVPRPPRVSGWAPRHVRQRDRSDRSSRTAVRRRQHRHRGDGSPVAGGARRAPHRKSLRRRDVRRQTCRSGMVDIRVRRHRLARRR